MENTKTYLCPEQQSESLTSARLIDTIAQKLMNGQELLPEVYAGHSPEVSLAEIGVLFEKIAGKTLHGKPTDLQSTLKERLSAFSRLSEALESIASLGVPSLMAASFAAELHYAIKSPAIISSKSFEDAPFDPNTDSLLAIYQPAFHYLVEMHKNIYTTHIRHLIPDVIFGESTTRSGLGKMQAGVPLISTALQSFQEDPKAYDQALLMTPRRLHINIAENRQQPEDLAEALGVVRSDMAGDWSVDRLEFIHTFGNNRAGNYIDQTLLFTLGYAVARRQSYTPEEARALLAQSLPQIGRLSHYTFDSMPSSEARTDLSPDRKSNPRTSLSALLPHARYVSIADGIPRLSYTSLPLQDIPPYEQCEPSTRFRLEKDGRSRGWCPARFRITCSPEMQEFIDEAKQHGYNIDQNETRYGTARKVKLSTLSALMALIAAEEHGTFQRLERNSVFQNFLDN